MNPLANPRTVLALLILATIGLMFRSSPVVAQPRLEVAHGVPPLINLTWPGADTGYTLETTAVLGPGAIWQPVPTDPVLANGRHTVVLAAAAQTRFFRLRRSGAAALTDIAETSPAQGESGVAVTRETIFRFSAPLAPDVTFSSDQLYAEFGERELLARAELSSDRRTATLFYLENLPASARVRVKLEGATLRDLSGKPLDADGDGQPGGVRVLEFNTAGIAGLANTAVRGKVFASEKNADGSNKPLENVTVTVDGAEESLRTATGSDGSFILSPAPAGRFFVHIDGRTAIGSQWPGGAYYPFVGKAWEAVAGKTNNLAGGSGEIFLPLIQSDVLKSVSATEETKVTFAPSVLAANPSFAGVEVNVPANSLFSDNGARGGMVGIAPVPPDRLPEPLPSGLNFPLVITVQTDGGSNFDRPVPVRFPNLPDPVTGVKLPPGGRTALWSFNHDTGRWEAQGTMTISADGQFAVSDPGVGIRQPGWHGVAPGTNASTNPVPEPPCFTCPKCDGDQGLKMWFSIVDLGMDTALMPVNMAPGLGCATGFALSGLRSARDCTFLDVDECPTSLRNNLINGGLGCIPVFGSLLGTTLSAGQTANEIDKYFDNCAGKPSPASIRSFEKMGGDGNTFEQDLQKARDLMFQQDEVNQALADLNALILGSPAWRAVEWRTSGSEYIRLLHAVRAAVDLSSPQAETISTEERAGILQLPRPAGISPADVQAMLSRFANTAPKGLQIPATAPNLAIFDRAATLLEQVYAQGWRSPHDGIIQAIIILSRLTEPQPPGTLLTSTGGGPGGRVFPSGRHHYLMVNLETGFTTRGRTSPQGTLHNLILAPDTRHAIIYYAGPTSGLLGASSSGSRIGMAMFNSQSAGELTRIPYATMLDDTFGDSDNDGLSDYAEVVMGTSSFGADSDGDGLKDGQEFAQGTNPLDGAPPATGLIAGAEMPGTALDVHAQRDHAFVAVSQNRLAIFKLNGFENPNLIAQLGVSGSPHAITGTGNTVALATTAGVTLVDVSDPAAPKQIAVVEPNQQAVAIAARGGEFAVAMQRGTLLLVDAATGAIKQRIDALDRNLQDVKYGGGRLFALSGQNLIALEAVDGLWLPVGRIVVGGSTSPLEVGRKLILNGDFAWVGHFTGFTVVQVGNPGAMKILASPPTTQAAIHDFALTGSGALAAITSFGGEGSLAVSLYDVRRPEIVTAFLGSFQTAGYERALTVHRGLALVAATHGGLQIVNFLPPDLGLVPPQVSLTPSYPGQLPRAEYGGFLPVTVRATDDVGIRSVGVEADGEMTETEGVVPLHTRVRMPARSSGKSTITLRATATDLAGNSSWSQPIEISLVDDATPPLLVSIEPSPLSKIAPGLINEVRVAFTENVTTAVTGETLRLIWSGGHPQLGTPDDVQISGTVTYEAASRSIVLRTPTPMAAGKYLVTLAEGIGDASGNIRVKPFSWEFETGSPPFVIESFPPANLVRVGGTLDELRFTFDQPVMKPLADTYVWNVTRRAFPVPGTSGGEFGPPVPISPLQVARSLDGRTFTLRTPLGFPPGNYLVTGSGPNVQAMRWEFHFRDVPNEATGAFEGGAGLITTWKYLPGPGVGDELLINVPGKVAPVEARDVKSIIAQTPIRFLRQRIHVQDTIQALGGLEIANTKFGPGVTHVRGPLQIFAVFGNEPSDIGPHTINAYGGGSIRTSDIRFSDPNGALVNHPGSTLVLSNNLAIANTGINYSNAGRIVNLGTLRVDGATGAFAPPIRLEDVRLRNEGRVELASGALKVNSLENEGEINVVAGGKLVLPLRTRGGVSSRITGEGSVEFGEFDASRRRVSAFADAELRGDLEIRGGITLVAGNLTLWRPLIRPEQFVELRNSSTLRLLSPARIASLLMPDGNLVCNSASEIGSLEVGSRADIRSASLLRITGDTRIQSGLDILGGGVVEFAGTTVVSNGTQTAAVYAGNGTFRNTGLWKQAVNSSQGSVISTVNENAQPGRGVFDNAGVFEQVTERPLGIHIPFRNSGRMVLARTTVEFDANPSFSPNRRGAYLPQPGGELVLNNTELRHNSAGTLDLRVGTVRGVGNIQAVGAGDPAPKVINRGVIRPGNPVGNLVIRATGGFEQTDSGELVFTLSATGNSYLRLDRTAATLAGTLTIELAKDFAPSIGQTFTVMNFTRKTGDFTALKLPTPVAGRKFEVVQDATGITVNVVAQ